MLGVETSSNRLKASMLEIQETITTWPQLASGVVLGGGICTDVCRRILLNELSSSGRFLVDLEALIKDPKENQIENTDNKAQASKTPPAYYLNMLKTAEIHTLETVHAACEKLTTFEIQNLIEAACLAPSGGNFQPWLWAIHNRCLYLFEDEDRKTSVLNYENRANWIAFGASIENLVLTAHAKSYEVRIDYFPLANNTTLIAAFHFYKNSNSEKSVQNTHAYDHLAGRIPLRVTNRNLGERKKIPPQDLQKLLELFDYQNNLQARIFQKPNELNALKKIITSVDRLFYTDKSGNAHLSKELRWNDEEASATRDGLDINTIDLTATEKVGYTVSQHWEVTQYIQKWKLGGAFGKVSGKAIDAASGICVICLKNTKAETCLEGGRFIERFWLSANALGIAIQPMSISTFLFARCRDPKDALLPNITNELLQLSVEFNKIGGWNEKLTPYFILRMGYAPDPEIKSYRRFLNEVMLPSL
jgi:nitroreductase